jgi:hypothetical protein
MQAQDFAAFVASQQETDNERQENWGGIRDEWLRHLAELYNRIAEFLQEFVQAGSISYSFSEIALTEENIGTYQAKRMEIKIGRQHILLEPVATLLIASAGRVDVVGSAGRAQLMLVSQRAKSWADVVKVTVRGAEAVLPPAAASEEETAWAWKIVSRTVRGTFVELDKESFFTLLMEISGG